MPTRKITERERLTIFARTATDDELAQALEILQVESRVRGKAGKAVGRKPAAKKSASTPPPPKVDEQAE